MSHTVTIPNAETKININLNSSDDDFKSALNTIFDTSTGEVLAERDTFGSLLVAMEMENIQPVPDAYSRPHVTPMSMLAMRMRWGLFNPHGNMRVSVSIPPFNHIAVHIGKEKVFVMIVKGDEQITLEDDVGLYPSDRLVGQLLLLSQSTQNQ